MSRPDSRSSAARRLLVLMAVAIVVASACSSDSDDTSSESGGSDTSFEVGDCTTEVSDGSAEKVPCDDPNAAFQVAGVIEVGLSECSAGYETFETDGNNICLEEISLELTSLAVGDCTDATSEDVTPTKSLPCDDPEATARVVELADGVMADCTVGDISYGVITNGEEFTICQEPL